MCTETDHALIHRVILIDMGLQAGAVSDDERQRYDAAVDRHRVAFMESIMAPDPWPTFVPISSEMNAAIDIRINAMLLGSKVR